MTPAIALGKQDKILHTNAIVLMGVFTFLFLGAEYLYDNMIALAVSEDQTVFAQNYALGASAVGFLLYAVFHRFFNRLSQRVCSVLFAPVSVLCLFVIALHLSYGATLLSGLILFLLFGLL
ncbi:MAG: LuxR family transcriptional regulator, partial [Clostridia bacterium]